MKTDTLKKSLLDYAIKGRLTARFRRENNGLNAFDEISTYNEAIKEKRKDLEKKLKICEKELKLEKDKDKKALFKSQIQMLKKEIVKCKEITPLFNQSHEVQPLKASSGVWGVKGGIRGATSRADEVKPVIRKFKPPCPPLKEKTNNTESTHNEAGESEAPFTIPNSWAWVKLGDIASLQNGYAFKTEQFSNNGIPIIKIGDIQQGKINLANCVFLNNENIDDFKDYQVVKNDILIAMSGATTGKVGIYTDERLALLNQRVGLLRIENTFLRKYIFYFLTFYSADNLKQSAGSAQPNLSTQQINATFIPLPPLKEQQEIVKKLDLLVTLANDFAITKENLKRIEKRIEKSLLKLALEGSLSKLYRRSSPTLSAFDEINTYNEAIKEKRKDLEKELKKCEKELKLEKDKDKKAFLKSQIQMLKKELTKCKEITPLFCHTEPLGEVSNNIESTTSIIAKRKGVYPLPAPLNPEKNKAAAVSKEASLSFRQSRGEPRLSASSTQAEAGHYCPPFSAFAHHEAGESEAPFEIPNSWAWVKGYDIFLPIDNTEPQGDFFKYIDIDSIDNKNKKVKSPKTIETKNASSRARRPLKYGDVLFSMVRPYLENIALIDEALADCIASTGFFVCRTNILDSRFLYYLMTSPYVVYGLNSFMKGDNSPSIVKDDILNFNYPLPPLCEQEHIVQTLDTLFTLKKGLRVE